MNDTNKVELVGTLEAVPTVKVLPSGKELTTLLVTTVERWESKYGGGGERSATHAVIVWGKSGTSLVGRIRAGDRVEVEGRLSSRSYERNGETRYFTEIVATSVQPQAVASDPRQRSIPGTEPPPSKHTTRYARSMHADDSEIPF